MTNTENQQFKIVAAITKHYIRKSADGTEKYVLEGMASNTKIDQTGERMADSAIEAMAKSLETNTVYLNNEHGSDWDDDFGEVTKLWVNQNHELMMEAELDPDHYRTQTLIKGLEKGKQLGLSIGGIVKAAAMEWFADLGRKVMTYKDISLFHVAITGTPAVAETWVTPITKSVKGWKDLSMPENKEHIEKSEDVTTEVEESAAAEEVQAEVVAEDVVAEQPGEEATDAVVTEEAPAEGDAPEATDQDTTEKSDAETSDQDDEPETEANADEAAAQEEEAPASAESAPEQADADAADVQKSAIFGEFAEADVAAVSVRVLTEELSWRVWGAVYAGEEDERTPEERKAFVAQALAEYSAIVQTVANALIDNGAPADAEKSFVIDRAEVVAKSLSEQADQVSALTTSLSEKEAELATVAAELEEKTGELETTTKALETATNELDTIKARKSLAFTQLDTTTATDGKTKKSVRDYWAESVYGTKERIAE